ncbi:MAG: hypothetical protein JO227_00575 [Acetobacteraceae bacterium]|nr:hypothetical protein [Acetobacteraceae bacterium]
MAPQDECAWDALAKYAKLAAKGGMTFGCGTGGNTNPDAIDMHRALFEAFGAELVDSKGTQIRCHATGIEYWPEAGEVVPRRRGEL